MVRTRPEGARLRIGICGAQCRYPNLSDGALIAFPDDFVCTVTTRAPSGLIAGRVNLPGGNQALEEGWAWLSEVTRCLNVNTENGCL